VDVAHIALIAAAGFAAGVINAIAGGGSLVTFPALVEIGLPNVVASMTNTVALCPGYFGAAVAQRRDLAGQGHRASTLLPLAIGGSLLGSWILMNTTERSFIAIVPFLLAFAAMLLALQGRLKRALGGQTHARRSVAFAIIPVGAGAIYGAYFGAGLGVILLAIIAVVIEDTLVRANALKQVMSLVINTTAAIVFVAMGTIEWRIAAIVAVASLVGGLVGGRLASRIPEAVLRWTAITVALIVAAIYFARAYL
jgi:uncharacterized membrane protein YfcA